MLKWLSAAVLVSLCAACGGSGTSEPPTTEAAADAKGEAATPAEKTDKDKDTAPPAPEYREVTLPVGTTLRLELKSSVASDSSRIEDPVRAVLRQPVVVDGKTVLSAGTELIGTVTDVAQSGRVKGRARVAYRFTTLRHDSERYDIRTAPISHEAKTTKKKDAAKVAIGAGAGAAIGAILGGGSGAAKGAAIGGAGGTGAVLATRGEEVRLGPGADVNTRLMSPLTVRVKI